MKLKKTLLVLSAALALSGSLFGGECRDLVYGNKKITENAKGLYELLLESYQYDLERYKSGEYKVDGINGVFKYIDRARQYQRSPKIYNYAMWDRDRRNVFNTYCGGYNKKDQKVSREYVYWNKKKKALLKKIIYDPYFIANWRSMKNKPLFEGIADFREVTGYNRN